MAVWGTIGIIVAALITAIVGPVVIETIKRTPVPSSPTPVLITKSLIAKAWDSLSSRDYQSALTIADECINMFEPTALQMQRDLTASGEPTPPVGQVDMQTNNKIQANGLLNDVAGCYFSKGAALESLGHIAEAREAYKAILKFPDARIWDPPSNKFWSPAEAASMWLAKNP